MHILFETTFGFVGDAFIINIQGTGNIATKQNK